MLCYIMLYYVIIIVILFWFCVFFYDCDFDGSVTMMVEYYGYYDDLWVWWLYYMMCHTRQKYGYCMMVIYYMVMIMDALELWNDMDSVQLLL